MTVVYISSTGAWGPAGMWEGLLSEWMGIWVASPQRGNSEGRDSSPLPNQSRVHSSPDIKGDLPSPETSHDVSTPPTVTEAENKTSELPGALPAMERGTASEARSHSDLNLTPSHQIILKSQFEYFLYYYPQHPVPPGS